MSTLLVVPGKYVIIRCFAFLYWNKLCKAQHSSFPSTPLEAYEVTTYHATTFLHLTVSRMAAQAKYEILSLSSSFSLTQRDPCHSLQPTVQRSHSYEAALDVVSLRRRGKKTRGRQLPAGLCVLRTERHNLPCSSVWFSGSVSHNQKQTNNCWNSFFFFSSVGSKGTSFWRGAAAKLGPGCCHKAGMRLNLCLSWGQYTQCIPAKRADTFMTEQVLLVHNRAVTHHISAITPSIGRITRIALNYANDNMSQNLTWRKH